ncbi:MAG TPA: sialidase family protein [Thermoguttaceae bacterium]|nr:sialidase family protein [Thermoguttaceae bacterium]
MATARWSILLAALAFAYAAYATAKDGSTRLALEEVDARQDRTCVVFDGKSPNKLVCDTTLRELPDGSWVLVMLGYGDTEPLPANRICIARSSDRGKTWSAVSPIDFGVKSQDPQKALCPSELMVRPDRCTLVVSVHNGGFGDWKTYFAHSADGCRTWSALEPAPGKLAVRTFIRNHVVTRDGRILMPFQHYNRCDAAATTISKGRFLHTPRDPRNGVIASSDGGKTWEIFGDVRITDDEDYHGWAENNVVELADGTIAMMIRADRLGGALYYAESKDGGRTWPEFARKTDVPNPGSKATLYALGGDRVALLHNPNPKHRSPLALWISFDGMNTWPYRRVLVPESVDEGGRLNYPDGFVSRDGRYLHFAFDDNRHRAVYYGAKLPTR